MPESGNLLVGIRMKKTSKVDLKGPIVSYIKRVYGDRMAIDATESLDELQDLRNQVHSAGVPLSILEHLFSTLCNQFLSLRHEN